MEWCESCNSYHVQPKTREDAIALGCKANSFYGVKLLSSEAVKELQTSLAIVDAICELEHEVAEAAIKKRVAPLRDDGTGHLLQSDVDAYNKVYEELNVAVDKLIKFKEEVKV